MGENPSAGTSGRCVAADQVGAVLPREGQDGDRAVLVEAVPRVYLEGVHSVDGQYGACVEAQCVRPVPRLGQIAKPVRFGIAENV
ncbi:hypothetical protein [Embleya sp. NPDC001921]